MSQLTNGEELLCRNNLVVASELSGKLPMQSELVKGGPDWIPEMWNFLDW